MIMESMKILGVMSGTSLDGLDLALCKFRCSKGKWNFEVLKAETIQYNLQDKEKLRSSMGLTSAELVKLDHEYGKWIGDICNNFLIRNKVSTDLIASHGHTVFHNPKESYTLQIGNGHDIAAISNLPVIYDFRSMDIALGGQGAPLVPIGDDLLFPEYAACINLGGFSNISFRSGTERIAYDICPLNIALNFLAEKIQKEYDEDGRIGRKGNMNDELFQILENIPYYSVPSPKSLGKEWFSREFKSFLDADLQINDIFRTVYEHLSSRIAEVLSGFAGKEVLVTGGGAHNSFLMELLRKKSGCKLILPGDLLIDFKEAIIFGFLGYLRYHNINNTLKSVTGAERDCCAGILVNPRT